MNGILYQDLKCEECQMVLLLRNHETALLAVRAMTDTVLLAVRAITTQCRLLFVRLRHSVARCSCVYDTVLVAG